MCTCSQLTEECSLSSCRVVPPSGEFPVVCCRYRYVYRFTCMQKEDYTCVRQLIEAFTYHRTFIHVCVYKKIHIHTYTLPYTYVLPPMQWLHYQIGDSIGSISVQNSIWCPPPDNPTCTCTAVRINEKVFHSRCSAKFYLMPTTVFATWNVSLCMYGPRWWYCPHKFRWCVL